MEELHYQIRINATKETVWNTMLDAANYKEWAKAFSSDSQFKGEWKQGRYIQFIDPNMGGTKAILEILTPYRRIHAKHVAIINKDGIEDTDSEVAKKWQGITETYDLNELDDHTELSITIHTHPDFAAMFNSCWPNALALLKDICERQE